MDLDVVGWTLHCVEIIHTRASLRTALLVSVNGLACGGLRLFHGATSTILVDNAIILC
jgi:hypothetical protein